LAPPCLDYLAADFPLVQTRLMGKLVGILVCVAVAFGIFYFTMKKMPATDPGTAPTQAISLTGVRRDLLSIAQAERSHIALNARCVSVEDLISAGSLTLSKPERDGYSYSVECNGDSPEFKVIARHAPAPEGSPIRYPTLGTDQTMQVGEVQ
jgi:hypothetical protein